MLAALAAGLLLFAGLAVAGPDAAQAAETNLAMGKTATASGVYHDNPTYAASRAVDGQSTSRWATDAIPPPHWLRVDLARTFTFDRVVIGEYQSRITTYAIQTSADGASWQTVHRATKQAGSAHTTTTVELDEPATGRYVRLLIDAASTGPSVYEFEVYGEVPIGGEDTLVKTPGELAEAIRQALPGDTITMADGTWNDVVIELSAYTAPEHPVTLRAQSPGKVVITGRSGLSLNRPNLIVEGLTFKDGQAPEGKDSVITFNSDHGRVTDTAVIDFNPPEPTTDYYWVFFRGAHNRLDHTLLEGKNHHQPVVGNNGTGIEKYNRVDHCHVKDIKNVGMNGMEALRIWGYGQNGELGTDEGAFFTVEYNLFEHADGDDEIISLKSNHNTVRRNTIIESYGGIVGRSGNFNTVTDNVVLGNHYPGSNGIRVSGDHHTVTGNLISKVAGDGLRVTSGEHVFDENLELDYLTPDFVPLKRDSSPYGYVFHYGQVTDGDFSGNVFLENDGVDIHVGFFYKNHWPQYQMVLLPERNTFSRNLVYKPAGGTAVHTTVQETAPPLDKFTFEPNTFKRNFVFGGDVDVNAPSTWDGGLSLSEAGGEKALELLEAGKAPTGGGEGSGPNGRATAPLGAQDVGPSWTP